MRDDPFNGLRIVTERKGGKLWVWVNGNPISFHEIFDIIQGLIACERDKYGHRIERDPAFMVQRFLAMCCKDGITWPELERESYLTPADRQRARERKP